MNTLILAVVCTVVLLAAIAANTKYVGKKFKCLERRVKRTEQRVGKNANTLGQLGTRMGESPKGFDNMMKDNTAAFVTAQAKKRREQKSGMQTTKLEMRHTENCKLLPDRFVLLDLMPKEAVIAEIGAAYGDFSKEILERCAPKQLHLVDAWATERYQIGLDTIKSNLSDAIAQDRLFIHQGLSTEMLPKFDEAFFDWVYIDTNHTYDTTLEELLICDSKVKDTGRIAGHDFCTGNVVDAVPYGVVEAVTKFCKDRNWEFEYLTVESHGHFSFCLKRSGT